MKKILVLMLTFAVCFILCACSQNSNDTATDNEISVESTTESEKKENKTISMDVEKGSIKYVGFEKANSGLVDEENVYVFKFAFTNNQEAPAQSQSAFSIKFYQKGVEMNDSISWSSNGGDQYELANNFFSTVMKGGTVEYGRLVQLKDNTPVTIMVSESGSSDNYQMMEVDVSKEKNKSDDEAVAGENAASESATNTTESTTANSFSNLWSLDYYVDDFNEPTDEWIIYNDTYFNGSFSNSATTDSNLTVQMLVDCNKEIAMFLYEYGRNQVKNSSESYVDEYKIVMRTADGKDHNLTGTLYCGGDRIIIDKEYVDVVLKALKGEGDVMFRIVNKERTVESYLFKVKTDNFAQVYNEQTKK